MKESRKQKLLFYLSTVGELLTRFTEEKEDKVTILHGADEVRCWKEKEQIETVKSREIYRNLETETFSLYKSWQSFHHNNIIDEKEKREKKKRKEYS